MRFAPARSAGCPRFKAFPIKRTTARGCFLALIAADASGAFPGAAGPPALKALPEHAPAPPGVLPRDDRGGRLGVLPGGGRLLGLEGGVGEQRVLGGALLGRRPTGRGRGG